MPLARAMLDTINGLIVGYSCNRYSERQEACGVVLKGFMSLSVKGEWDWVREKTEGRYSMCRRVLAVIQRIMDIRLGDNEEIC